jgi:chromosome segregation ATPase
MNNPMIELALLELESNLTEIKSANEQVTNVVAKGEKLNSSVLKLVKTIEEITKSISIDKDKVDNLLKENFKNLKEGLLKIQKETEITQKKYEEQLESLIETSSTAEIKINELNSYISNFKEKLQEFNFNQEFKKTRRLLIRSTLIILALNLICIIGVVLVLLR